jgi:ABC-type arginine/histidine transport system permease subunit
MDISAYDYVRFVIADINGVSRGKTIPRAHVPNAILCGISAYSGEIVFLAR